jgi:pyridinium-3,5-biscarboxylic acid mononucleotide sulfurtransferase
MTSLTELESVIAASPSAIVAFSGGVDSSVVAAAAARVLGDRAIAITAVSPALATGELDGARSVAAAVGIAHRSITTDELSRAGYRRNGPDRCYHCKTELYDRLAIVAEQEGYASVYSGANVDDLGDWRPGLKAASEHGVRHPLVEAGFRKADVRREATALDIPSADKPAMPCLASRIPHGTEVEPHVLAQIDLAERSLRSLGFRNLRVRHLGSLGKIEFGEQDLAAADRCPEDVIAAVLAAGYMQAEIDPEPLRSGSFTGMRQLPLLVR